MRGWRSFVPTSIVIAVAAFLALGGWFARPEPAHALGSIIIVDTTVDTEAADGYCSMREAINAANINGIDDTCGPGTGADAIYFSLTGSNPEIDIGSTPLPAITDQVNIRGNTGGATRVVLHGPGDYGFSALAVTGTGGGTSIRYLVVNNFTNGIFVNADNVTLAGNFIGTDASGMLGQGNFDNGVLIAGGASARVGGTNGTSPGGACTGDCNLISGNPVFGINLNFAAVNAIIQGNFIGTNASGAGVGLGNDRGVAAYAAGIIGGDIPQARNVISGNIHEGVSLAGGGTVKGNFIGTTSAGTQSVPNLSGGVLVYDFYNPDAPAYILENVISGNGTAGVEVDGSANVRLFGNLIGTAPDGTTPVANYTTADGPGFGVLVWNGAHDNIIGSPLPGEPNVIAFNNVDGVRVQGTGSYLNFIGGNSIHDNGGQGINNVSGGNIELLPPVIASANAGSVSGTACVFPCTVDLFADAADEGKTYLGTVQADNGGLWTFTGTVLGPNVTATDTDPTIGTSEFSEPVAGPVLIQGDVDCSGAVSSVDALKLLRHNVGLTVSQNQPCPIIGSAAGGYPFGDVDCSSAVNSADALKVLRYKAGLSVTQHEPCPDIAAPLGG